MLFQVATVRSREGDEGRVALAFLRNSLAVFGSAIVLILNCAQGYAAGAVELAGDVLQYALPAGAGGLTLGLQDWPGTLQLGESEGLTLATTYALKYGLDTRRPNGGSLSFPSGHASVSFSAAEFLRKRYGWEAGIPAYAAASFVAYSRVESGQHYYYDVIGGAAIGVLSSFIFTRPYHGWEIKTEASSGIHGLFLSRTW